MCLTSFVKVYVLLQILKFFVYGFFKVTSSSFHFSSQWTLSFLFHQFRSWLESRSLYLCPVLTKIDQLPLTLSLRRSILVLRTLQCKRCCTSSNFQDSTCSKLVFSLPILLFLILSFLFVFIVVYSWLLFVSAQLFSISRSSDSSWCRCSCDSSWFVFPSNSAVIPALSFQLTCTLPPILAVHLPALLCLLLVIHPLCFTPHFLKIRTFDFLQETSD